MKKYIKFFRRIFRLSLLKMSSYSQDFAVTIFIIPIFMVSEAGLLVFMTNYSSNGQLAGFGIFELIFVLCCSRLITDLATFSTLTSARLPYQIKRGELDYFLCKPISSFVSIGVQQFFVKASLGMVFNISVIFLLLLKGFLVLSITQFFLILFVFIQSIVLYLTILYAAGLLSFYFDGLTDVQDFVHETKNKTSNYPEEVFPPFLKSVFTFVVPVFLITIPIFKVLHNSYTTTDMSTGAGVTAIFIAIAALLWTNGLKRYSSSN